jgi:hypothetical protein
LLEFEGGSPYLLLLGDMLPELACLLLQRLHPRRSITERIGLGKATVVPAEPRRITPRTGKKNRVATRPGAHDRGRGSQREAARKRPLRGRRPSRRGCSR